MPADLSMYKPHFVRALGAVDPRPTIARFEVQQGVRALLRDAARRELIVRVAPPDEAPGAALRTERSAVDVLADHPDAPAHRAWTEAVCAAVLAAEATPGWDTFLRAAWTT